MLEASSTAVTFYPAYCWTASPTYNTWVKLSAADVHNLKRQPGYEGQRLYFHQNHPIRHVRLVGLVTSFDDATETTVLSGPGKVAQTARTPWTFALDDGSGELINVVCWKDAEHAQLATRPGEEIKLRFADLHKKAGRSVTDRDISLDDVELGKVVKVKGWVDEFREQRQILLERIEVLADTAAEVVAWEELANFQREVLSKPWLLSKSQILDLREKQERREKRLAKREQRRHAEMDPGATANEVAGQERRYRVRTMTTKSRQASMSTASNGAQPQV